MIEYKYFLPIIYIAFMMVYIWGRSPENSQTRMNLLGLFVFRAPYLAWVLLLFSVVLGNPVETDLLGIIPGHIYYFLEFVYPKVADIRGWRVRKPLQTPAILHYLFGSVPGSMRVSNTSFYKFFYDILV